LWMLKNSRLLIKGGVSPNKGGGKKGLRKRGKQLRRLMVKHVKKEI